MSPWEGREIDSLPVGDGTRGLRPGRDPARDDQRQDEGGWRLVNPYAAAVIFGAVIGYRYGWRRGLRAGSVDRSGSADEGRRLFVQALRAGRLLQGPLFRSLPPASARASATEARPAPRAASTC